LTDGFERGPVHPVSRYRVCVDASGKLAWPSRQTECGHDALIGNRPYQAAKQRPEAGPEERSTIRRQHVVHTEAGAKCIMRGAAEPRLDGATRFVASHGAIGHPANANRGIIISAGHGLRRLGAAAVSINARRGAFCFPAAVRATHDSGKHIHREGAE
jgi:hypothetical protein